MPPEDSINAMIEPTKTTKAKVLSIHGVLREVLKSSKSDTKVCIIAKSLTINKPRSIPLKRDNTTLRVIRAKKIARREGKRERAEGSMAKTLSLKVLVHCVQIFLDTLHILFVFFL